MVVTSLIKYIVRPSTPGPLHTPDEWEGARAWVRHSTYDELRHAAWAACPPPYACVLPLALHHTVVWGPHATEQDELRQPVFREEYEHAVDWRRDPSFCVDVIILHDP